MTTILLPAMVVLASAAMYAARWSPIFSGSSGSGRRGWQERTVHDLSAARDLMDWLEACGTAEQEFAIHGDTDYVVRWR